MRLQPSRPALSLAIVLACLAGTADAQSRAVPKHAPPPEYPAELRRAGVTGTVLVGVKVLANGIPSEVVVFKTSGNERLDRAATDAVKGWTFEPAMGESGKALPGQFTIALKFVLEAEKRTPISPLITLTCSQAVSLEDEKASDAENSLRARSLALMRESHPRAEQLVAIDRAFSAAYDKAMATCRNSSSEVFLRILIGALVAAGV